MRIASDDTSLAGAIVTRLALLALLVVLVHGPGVPSVDAPVTIRQALLEALRAEAAPVLERALGSRVPYEVALRLGDAQAMGDLLAREVDGRLKLYPPDQRDAVLLAARELAPYMLGKFTLGEAAILVQPAAFGRVQDLAARDDLVTRGAVGAVLVHELVHAADDARVDFERCLADLRDAAQLVPWNAAVEGHAQVVTRAVCAELGWTDGFLAFSEAVTADPERLDGLDEARRQLARVLSADMRSSYSRGEDFVRELLRAGGRDAVDAILRDPPDDPSVVIHPGWHLDPTTRPRPRHDLDAIVAEFVDEHPAPRWTMQLLNPSRAVLDASYHLLPAERREALLDDLLDTRIAAAGAVGTSSRQIVLALSEVPDEQAAREWVDASLALSRAKDAAMAEGSVAIVASSYEDLALDALQGFTARKTVRIGPRVASPTQDVLLLVARSGTLVFELNCVEVPGAERRALALASLVLDADEASRDDASPDPEDEEDG